MKIILTGSTGVIGSAVLQKCLQNPSITSIVVLSRRPLSSHFSSPKLKVIILTDFLTYPDDVLAQLDDAQACIWYFPISGPMESPAQWADRLMRE
jgi:nucleoside-diphosphate-sugar epimerase